MEDNASHEREGGRESLGIYSSKEQMRRCTLCTTEQHPLQTRHPTAFAYCYTRRPATESPCLFTKETNEAGEGARGGDEGMGAEVGGLESGIGNWESGGLGTRGLGAGAGGWGLGLGTRAWRLGG